MNYKELIKDLLLSSADKAKVTFKPRMYEIQLVPRKATIIVGVRRCGKSTYLEQIKERLRKNNTEDACFVHINFVDDRLHFLNKENLGLISQSYYELYPANKNQTVYFFLDEIQEVNGWEFFVERLLREENVEVVITGSSAKLLSKEIATQMRGRSLSWEMFPLSFKEFLQFQGIDTTFKLTHNHKLLIRKVFFNFFESGGFPETIELNKELRVKIHQEYYHSILYRDLIERNNISNPKLFSEIAYHMISNMGTLISINKITNRMKSMGHKTSRESISNYLEYLEDAYFMYQVGIYDSSTNFRTTSPKKIYCVDHALAQSVASKIMINSGHALENIIFMALRQKGYEVYYYKTKNDLEVDFITIDQNNSKHLIQVSETIHDEKTKMREVKALQAAMEELNISKGIIITNDEDGFLQLNNCEITIIPAWQWLYSLN